MKIDSRLVTPAKAGVQGWGGVRRPDDEKIAQRTTILVLLCGLPKAMVVPAKAGIKKGRGEGIVALGLVARLVRAASPPAWHRPASHDFHSLPASMGGGERGM